MVDIIHFNRWVQMPHSLSGVNVHLVFGVKYRSPLLTANIRVRLFGFIAATLERNGCFPLAVNGPSDHVHALFVLGRQHSIAKIVEQLKKTSSKWLKSISSEHSSFYWQVGYGIFSVGHSEVKLVKKYIHNQEIHHRTVSFVQERNAILAKYGFSPGDWTFDELP